MNKGIWESNRFPILLGCIFGGFAGAGWGLLIWRDYWWIGMILGSATGAAGGIESESILEAGCLVLVVAAAFPAFVSQIAQWPGNIGVLARIVFGLIGSLAFGLSFGRLGGSIVRRDYYWRFQRSSDSNLTRV